MVAFALRHFHGCTSASSFQPTSFSRGSATRGEILQTILVCSLLALFAFCRLSILLVIHQGAVLVLEYQVVTVLAFPSICHRTSFSERPRFVDKGFAPASILGCV